MEKVRRQANTDFTDRPDLWDALEQMRQADMRSRSSFIKRLIEQEASRRAVEIARTGKAGRRMAENGR